MSEAGSKHLYSIVSTAHRALKSGRELPGQLPERRPVHRDSIDLARSISARPPALKRSESDCMALPLRPIEVAIQLLPLGY